MTENEELQARCIELETRNEDLGIKSFSAPVIPSPP